MDFESLNNSIDEWIKSLILLVQHETSQQSKDRLLIYHSTNAIKTLSKIQSRIQRGWKR